MKKWRTLWLAMALMLTALAMGIPAVPKAEAACGACAGKPSGYCAACSGIPEAICIGNWCGF